MTDIDQETRLLSVETPLGADVLILQSFTGNEAVSDLFLYQLEMLSSDGGIAPADIVGKKLTFSVIQADGSKRYFNGYVNRFVGGAMHTRELRRYRAEVVPWLWFLTLSADCRIFQLKTVPQIIEQVFQDLGYNDFEIDLQGNHPEREYCVQYRESTFNFVSRLMEEEGMFYCFRHEDAKHTLVITDHIGGYLDCPENEIEYIPGSLTSDHISEWEHHYEYCSGKYAQTDYDFKKPRSSLFTTTNTLIDLPDIGNHELYDYPGEYRVKADGEDLTKIRMEEQEVPHDIVRCVSGCRTLHTLGKFTITRHECLSEENKTYVITDIQHSANDQSQLVGGADTYYQNSFSCIPGSVIFRSGRITRKPKIRGPQTAVVVGPAGEEIYPDEYGRVKVQFHWDRLGKEDESSSCWVRVSQNWAGRGWGGMYVPHIGHEVVVSFLEGDPDRPIITGRVYNADNMPSEGLPGNKTKSGWRDHGGNELVMEGADGGQFIHMNQTCGNEMKMQHEGPDIEMKQACGNEMLIHDGEGIQIRDEYGNEIVLDSAGGTIRIYSPTHSSEMALGRSLEWSTDSDWKSDVRGDRLEHIVGKVDVKVGSDVINFFVGNDMKQNLGLKSRFVGGIKEETIIGAEAKYIRGAKQEIINGVVFKRHYGMEYKMPESGKKDKTPSLLQMIDDYKAVKKNHVEKISAQRTIETKGALLEKAQKMNLQALADMTLKADGSVEHNAARVAYEISDKLETQAGETIEKASKILKKASEQKLKGDIKLG